MLKKLPIFTLCAALALFLTGCANGKVESTVSNAASKAANALDSTISRIEDDTQSMFDDASNVDSGIASSMDENDWQSGTERVDGAASGHSSDIPNEGSSQPTRDR